MMFDTSRPHRGPFACMLNLLIFLLLLPFLPIMLLLHEHLLTKLPAIASSLSISC